MDGTGKSHPRHTKSHNPVGFFIGRGFPDGRDRQIPTRHACQKSAKTRKFEVLGGFANENHEDGRLRLLLGGEIPFKDWWNKKYNFYSPTHFYF
jgi:hypothetical protein